MKSIISKTTHLKATYAVALLSILLIPIAMYAVSDVTPPSVSIVTPVSNVTVVGSVLISANATDLAIPASDCLVTVFGVQYDVTSLQSSHPGGNIFVCGTDMTTVYQGQHGTNVSRLSPFVIPQKGISKVELWIDGVLKSTDTSFPYNFSWNSTTVQNGTHNILVKAFDLANNEKDSNVITITTNNTTTTIPSDIVAPVVSILSSLNTSTTPEVVSVLTTSTDNVGVAKVELYVDGILNSTSTAYPFSFLLNTNNLTSGTHTLLVKAYDAVGNVGTSTTVSITVATSTLSHHGDGDGEDKNEGNEHDNRNENSGKQIDNSFEHANEHHSSNNSGGLRVGLNHHNEVENDD